MKSRQNYNLYVFYMTSYAPPTSSLAVFSASTFNSGSTALTQAVADTRYLRYSVSQGSETISQNLSVNGITSLNGLANSNASINASSNDTTIATTAFVKAQGYATQSNVDNTIGVVNTSLNNQIASLTDELHTDVSAINATIAQVIATEATDIASLNARATAFEAKEAADIQSVLQTVAALAQKEIADVALLTTNLNAQISKEFDDFSLLSANLNALITQKQQDVVTINQSIEGRFE